MIPPLLHGFYVGQGFFELLNSKTGPGADRKDGCGA